MPSTRKQRVLESLGPDAWQEVITQPDGAKASTLITTPTWVESAYPRLWRGSQITDSEEHPGWHRSRGRQDAGGSFLTRKKYLETDIVTQTLTSHRRSNGVTSDRRYVGPVLAAGATTASFPAFVDRSDTILNQRGAEAVARCKPTNAVADLSVALGELYRERLPSITRWDQIKYETDKARRAGSEYLKSEFGWMPLLGELNDFIRATTHAGELLSQYERDAGRVVRRQYSFPTEKSSTSQVLSSVVSPALLGVDPAGYRKTGTLPEGRVVKTSETVRKTWFSGAFSYTLPVGYKSHDALVRQAARASVLYGAELTPSTVWNLAPWSWAVDWFSNVGDVLSNASDYLFDGLVMRYGYIMEHSLVRDSYAYYGESNFQTPVAPQTLVFVSETKKRRQANPFGFGVSWNGLTPRQIAISVALGLTKK